MKNKLSLDAFYTPAELAKVLINHVRQKDVMNIADFCVGDGELLRAAQERFPHAEVYGTDISSEVILKLRNSNTKWHLAVCDILQSDQFESSEMLEGVLFDLIVFNPPFTCKGSVIHKVFFQGHEFKVSTAMMFVLHTVNYLSERGGMYAILPVSCVYSQKDREAWNFLQQEYNATVIDEPQRVNFTNKCAPNIVLVYIGKAKLFNGRITYNHPFNSLPVIDITRGVTRMHELHICKEKGAIHLVHTTNMRNGQLVAMKRIKSEG